MHFITLVSVTRIQKTGSSSRSLVKVHFQILKSPTDRREAPVVTCEYLPALRPRD